MKEICLIIEYYSKTELVYAELLFADMADDFVYTENFKVRTTDTAVIPNEEYSSIYECEHRVIKVDDAIGLADSRFIKIA